MKYFIYILVYNVLYRLNLEDFFPLFEMKNAYTNEWKYTWFKSLLYFIVRLETKLSTFIVFTRMAC